MKEFLKNSSLCALWVSFLVPVMLVIYIVIFLFKYCRKAGKLIIWKHCHQQGLYSVLAIILAVLIVYLFRCNTEI